MKQLKQPLLMILAIFATAYVLTLIGCAPSTSDKKASAPGAADPQTGTGAPDPQPGQAAADDSADLVMVDPNDMPECKTEEFNNLVTWSNAVNAAKAAIQTPANQSKDAINTLAKVAADKCQREQKYHAANPCKRTKETVVDPGHRVLVNAYDGARIHQRCESIRNYVDANNLNDNNPSPLPVVSPDINPLNYRSCSSDEFTKLKEWRSALEIANKNIEKLGAQSDWKYDQNSIDAAKAATVLCEAEISYHKTQPCIRDIMNDATKKTDTKVYSADSLRSQCATARMYNYEFAQQSSSLIVPNAKLMLDTSMISGVEILPGYSSDKMVGQCILSSNSTSSVTYHGEKAVVTEARVYPNNETEGYQMFVMVTEEGVKFECYNLDYVSLKASKNEVVRLLKAKGTNLNLTYELN